MRVIGAFIRAAWLTAASYRLGMVLSLAGMLASLVPIYFVANALQPLIGKAIQHDGGEYFAFLLVGIIVSMYIADAVTALPNTVQSNVSSGTLDTLLSAPVHPALILGGMVAYPVVWTTLRAMLTTAAGLALGASFVWPRLPAALLVLALIIASYVPFSLLSTSMVVAFRTAGPLSKAVLTISAFLGGVYYPTHVIPSWIQQISAYVPLTYGLRALRRVLLEGQSLASVSADLTVLAGMTVVLWAVGLGTLVMAFGYARRAGTLSQY